jgi:pathogenesis-related protein 1
MKNTRKIWHSSITALVLCGLYAVAPVWAQDSTTTPTTVAIAPIATGSACTPAEVEEILAVHNQARKALGVAPLVWSQDLAGFAQQWAEKCAADNCRLGHRPYAGKWKQLYGENCAMNYGEKYGAKAPAVQGCYQWLAEKKFYKRKKQGSDWYKTGHYTQMVWRKSTEMGVGVAKCRNGGYIVVANYNPAGNMIGETAY